MRRRRDGDDGARRKGAGEHQDRTFELRRQFVATRPGTLEIPTSFLVFSEVESGGIFNSRQRTRSRYFVGAPPQSLEVRELPADGRPLDYSNAVGRFHVRATTDRWDVDAGDSIKLTLEWLGEGNLEFFERPDLARLDAFRGFRSLRPGHRHYAGIEALGRRWMQTRGRLDREALRLPPLWRAQ